MAVNFTSRESVQRSTIDLRDGTIGSREFRIYWVSESSPAAIATSFRQSAGSRCRNREEPPLLSCTVAGLLPWMSAGKC